MYQLICYTGYQYEGSSHDVIANLETLDVDQFAWLVDNHYAKVMAVGGDWYDWRKYYVVKQSIGSFLDSTPYEVEVMTIVLWDHISVTDPIVYQYMTADQQMEMELNRPVTIGEAIQDLFDTTVGLVTGKRQIAGMRAWTKRQRQQRRKARKSIR